MKRKLLVVLLSLIAAFCLCFGLTGCDLNGGGNTGDNSSTGNNTGNTGGNSGNTGGNSGNTGGNSGNTGGNSGNTGGNSGNTGGNSGNTGGNSGDSGNTGTPGGNTGDSGATEGGDTTCQHAFTADNKCEKCGAEWKFTEGLTYEPDEKGDAYRVTGIQRAQGNVVIPYGYQGKPVTAISGWTQEEIAEIYRQIFSEGVPSNRDEMIAALKTKLIRGLTGITIPDSVTTIDMSTFTFCAGLTSVSIPDSVTSIGEEAFAFCTELKSVNLGKGLTEIAKSAFMQCESLGSIVIPDGVKTIGNSAFAGCYELKDVTIPASMTSIEMAAFSGCSALQNINFKGTVDAWKNMHKSSSWDGTGEDADSQSGDYTVTCTNGTFKKDDPNNIPNPSGGSEGGSTTNPGGESGDQGSQGGGASGNTDPGGGASGDQGDGKEQSGRGEYSQDEKVSE